MKILIMNPPWLFKLPKADRLSNMLGPLYIATMAQLRGHEVTILDALREGVQHFEKVSYFGKTYYKIGLSYRDILSRIPKNIECIAISAPFTNLYHVISELTALLKKERPDTLIALGGGLPSAAPDLCFRLTHVDVSVIGEGEKTFIDYISDYPQLSNSDAPRLLCGQPIIDIEELPIPDRSLINMDHYFQVGSRNRTSLPTASMITSRGCPYSCHFCSIQPTMGSQWRGRSRKSVLEEISILVNNYGIQVIEFEDDNFLNDEVRAISILEDMAKFRREHSRLFAFSFPNGVRIDKLNPEILAMMKEAGLYKIVLPVEHGDLRIRRKMGKPLLDEEIYQACEWASSLGTIVEIFVMIGYPGESNEVFESGLKLIRKIGIMPNIDINYLFPQPYLGTRLRKECLENGYVIDVPDETLFCGIGPVITTPLFDRQEIDRRRKQYDILKRQLKAQSSRITASKLTQAAKSNHCENICSDGTRIAMKQQIVEQQLTGCHNGSCFHHCRIPSNALMGVTMMMSDFEYCNFSDADLSHFNASWSIFHQCHFQRTVFKQANLSHCKLRDADFSRLDISGIDLTKADLTGANLSRVHLVKANLYDANLIGTNFIKAILDQSNISGSTLASARMDHAQMNEMIARDTFFSGVSFRNALGKDVEMQRSYFSNCDFSHSRISGCFEGSLFHNCCFDDSVLEKRVETCHKYLEIWDGSGRHMVLEEE